jgi:hypothetical protein
VKSQKQPNSSTQLNLLALAESTSLTCESTTEKKSDNVHASFQKLIDQTQSAKQEFPHGNRQAGSLSLCSGETQIQDRRKPLEESMAAMPKALEVSMKRKSRTTRQKKIPRGGKPTRGRQDRSELQRVEICDALPAEPKSLHFPRQIF